MTQEERWSAKYNEVVRFLEVNHRRPSKYELKERNSWNWLRHNQKLFNNEAMNPERIERFEKLLKLADENKHVNQYQ